MNQVEEEQQKESSREKMRQRIQQEGLLVGVKHVLYAWKGKCDSGGICEYQARRDEARRGETRERGRAK